MISISIGYAWSPVEWFRRISTVRLSGFVSDEYFHCTIVKRISDVLSAPSDFHRLQRHRGAIEPERPRYALHLDRMTGVAIIEVGQRVQTGAGCVTGTIAG
jgi:hypothetical protein